MKEYKTLRWHNSAEFDKLLNLHLLAGWDLEQISDTGFCSFAVFSRVASPNEVLERNKPSPEGVYFLEVSGVKKLMEEINNVLGEFSAE